MVPKLVSDHRFRLRVPWMSSFVRQCVLGFVDGAIVSHCILLVSKTSLESIVCTMIPIVIVKYIQGDSSIFNDFAGI